MKTDDLRFAHKVRHALDQQLDTLPESAATRLAGARAAALAARGAPAGTGGLVARNAGWLGRAAVAVPLLAMAFGVGAIYQQEQHARLAEIAEVDAAVMSDELPLTAYLDNGFNAYLEQRLQ